MPLLVELHEFIKTLKVEREVPPEFYRDIAKVEFVQGPSYMLALVKATLCCPEVHYKSGKAKVFLQGDMHDKLQQQLVAEYFASGSCRMFCQGCVHSCADA